MSGSTEKQEALVNITRTSAARTLEISDSETRDALRRYGSVNEFYFETVDRKRLLTTST